MNNYRVYVEKRQKFQTEANSLKQALNENLGLCLTHVRLINIYDLFNVSNLELEIIKNQVLSETVTDSVYDHIDLSHVYYVATEPLPGLYDQRSDSAEQCIQLICNNPHIRVKSGKIIVLEGVLTKSQVNRLQDYIINPIEMRTKDLESPLILHEDGDKKPMASYPYFIDFDREALTEFLEAKQFAMTLDDLLLIQAYFKQEEKRNPTETELLVLDTYWSDHCRHTTFETILNDIKFSDDQFQTILNEAFHNYCEMRQAVHQSKKPMTLMDMATIKAKDMRIKGELLDLEISEEVNACSIYIDVWVNGSPEKWILMFKNETHNHPTEIEPFGGASTCIGGAIRDPLSGRAYVYQAMRVTGASDVLAPLEKTLPGKLPQKRISKSAADGYSSYGNQIGLATTHVREIYHEGFVAKRMEVGAVIGAVKASHIKRERPSSGDVILLIGGKTGRDGIGGATGSSKAHNKDSIECASSEVQKGNALVERKIQRLFRNPEVTRYIKKSNDFGAGGASVAIGELADGLIIALDKIPTKYKGLNATELAISESQERMAVVIAKEDVNQFCLLVETENLEATVVATITDENRLVMTYDGEEVVNLSRDFLNSNGVKQNRDVFLNEISPLAPFERCLQGDSVEEKFLNNLKDKNIASQKGLVEMFDSTVGASTVLMPFGGKYQLTEVDASVQKIPVLDGETNTCSIMTYGYNPTISSWSPFHGAIYAVVESLSKLVSVGGQYQQVRFSFQEYFRRLEKDPKNWGLPFAAMLGAIHAQNAFNLPAIGGKDSMSGSFEDHHVPPTLLSFAVGTSDALEVISPEFKAVNNFVYLISHQVTEDYLPDFNQLKENYDFIHAQIKQKVVISAFALKEGGVGEAIAKMSFGNKIGVKIENESIINQLFKMNYGAFLVESTEPINYGSSTYIGRTLVDEIIIGSQSIIIEDAISAWSGVYQSLYPTVHEGSKDVCVTPLYQTPTIITSTQRAQPSVLIPVFPGTNSEYDTMMAFKRAGAKTDMQVFRNLCKSDSETSIKLLFEALKQSQILMLSGGFSAGDEPDGSGKFITSILLNEQIQAGIADFLNRDGLILGICNGFQALIKSGLLPYGKIGELTENSPTLTRNKINRHVSKMIQTRVTSNKSPWLSEFQVGDVHQIPVSHGEGRFVANDDVITRLILNGQIATQYVDFNGQPTKDGLFNPNGSTFSIEGITSLDGRIFGKMGHSERSGQNLYKNITGDKSQDIFTNGVNYFK